MIKDLTASATKDQTPNNYLVTSNQNSMTVSREFFQQNHIYEVTCNVENTALGLAGGVRSRYDTHDFEKDFEFEVKPIREINPTEADET